MADPLVSENPEFNKKRIIILKRLFKNHLAIHLGTGSLISFASLCEIKDLLEQLEAQCLKN